WGMGTKRRASGLKEIREAVLAGTDLCQLGDERGRAPRRTAGTKDSRAHARSCAGGFLTQGSWLVPATGAFPSKTVHRLLRCGKREPNPSTPDNTESN